MTLTQAGIDRQFQLTTFASNFPVSGGIGPEGIGYAPDGTVMVTTISGNVQRFQNQDNQNAASVPVLTNHGFDGANDIRYLGNDLYMTRYAFGQVVQLNSNGTINRTVVGGLANPLGLAPNPFTGRLFVATNSGILDLNPVTGQFVTFATGSNIDGLTLSGDGSVLYAAYRGSVQRLLGFSVGTGATVFDSGPLTGGVDGVAVGFGPFAGFLYANMNDGRIIELNLANPAAQIVIATGGTRGDFVASDPLFTGHMLLTQADSVLRLQGIPSPSTALPLLGAGLLMRRRRGVTSR
jgi:hypothetical protein